MRYIPQYLTELFITLISDVFMINTKYTFQIYNQCDRNSRLTLEC